MFTGIIHGQGEVQAVEPMGSQTRLRIRALYALDGIVTGESIATNGTCLTVETHGERWFTAYASAETMRLTTLGGLRTGAHVNLERALAMGDRLGGHLVSGHVDCVAEVASVTAHGHDGDILAWVEHLRLAPCVRGIFDVVKREVFAACEEDHAFSVLTCFAGIGNALGSLNH